MKTIYLIENNRWKQFEYNKLSELKDEFISRNIRIDSDVCIDSNVTILSDVRIDSYVRIDSNVRIGSRVRIESGVRIDSNVRIIKKIQGSKHGLKLQTNGLWIGCEFHSLEYWLENYKKIGEENKYTDEEIKEYYNYILECKKLIYDTIFR